MEYAIAIDSGGTNYRLRAITKENRTIAEFIAPSAKHNQLGAKDYSKKINSNIDLLLSQFQGNRKDCKALFCGTSGLDSNEDSLLLNSIYKDNCGLNCPTKVINDAELAHLAVLGTFGILLIAGTGSIAFGINPNGERARAGGWLCSILGDQGGGAWISRKAISVLSRYIDGAIQLTPFINEISCFLKINNREELNSFSKTIPWSVPPLGQIVSKYALLGDYHAINILKESANSLFSIIDDLIFILDFDKENQVIPIGFWGSTILNSSILQKELINNIKGKYKNTIIKYPNKSALDEASIQAIKLWNN